MYKDAKRVATASTISMSPVNVLIYFWNNGKNIQGCEYTSIAAFIRRI